MWKYLGEARALTRSASAVAQRSPTACVDEDGRTMRGIPGRFLRRQFPNRLPMHRTRRHRITAPSTGWSCAAPRG